jgi:hypothetical protein
MNTERLKHILKYTGYGTAIGAGIGGVAAGFDLAAGRPHRVIPSLLAPTTTGLLMGGLMGAGQTAQQLKDSARTQYNTLVQRAEAGEELSEQDQRNLAALRAQFGKQAYYVAGFLKAAMRR